MKNMKLSYCFKFIIISFIFASIFSSAVKPSYKKDWSTFKDLVLNPENDSSQENELRKNKLSELLQRHPEYKNNYIDNRNATTIAIQNHDQDLFDLLLASKIKYKKKSNDLSLPLDFTAAHYGNLPALKKLLKRYPLSALTTEKIGHTTILHQVLSGNKDILELHVTDAQKTQKDLIAEILSIEGIEKILWVQDKTHRTCLHLMAEQGFNEELKDIVTKKFPFLFQVYPNPLILRDDQMYKVFDYAVSTKNIDLIDFFVNSQVRLSDKKMSFTDGQKEVINLLKHEDTKDITKENLDILLLKSSYKSLYLSLINFLLDKGANINHQMSNIRIFKSDFFCRYPLNLFRHLYYFNEIDILEYLIKKGLDIDATNIQGCSSLHYGCYFNSKTERLFNFLLENSKNINAQSQLDGYTPLHLAIRFGNFKFAILLINKGADLKIKDSDGFNPAELLINDFIYIQRSSDFDEKIACDLIKLLIDKGCYQEKNIVMLLRKCCYISCRDNIQHYFNSKKLLKKES